MSEPFLLKIEVEIIADNQLTKISIWDNYLLVCEGMGTIKTTLPPGDYQIDAQLGNQITHHKVRATKKKKTVKIPAIPLPSPVPLPEMSFYNPEHLKIAKQSSKNLAFRSGRGSQFLLFLRERPYKKNNTQMATDHIQNPLSYISLYKNGKQVIDFSQLNSKAFNTKDGCWSCSVEIEPDYYYLVVKTAKERLARPIISFPGWQTQLFLFTSIECDSEGEFFYNVDLITGSFLLASIEEGFDEKKNVAPQIELLKLARLKRQQLLSYKEIEEILETNGNPIQVLFAGYLLLNERNVNLDLLEKIIKSLRNRIGWMPDVEALELMLNPNSNITFLFPPLLLDSWSIIVNKSIKTQALVPLDSLSAQVARHLWIKEPWLLWNESELQIEELYRPDAKETESSIPALIKELRALDIKKDPKNISGITKQFPKVESILFSQLVGPPSSKNQLETSREMEVVDEIPSRNWEQELVSSLGMPLNVVKDTLVVLKEKILRNKELVKSDYPLFINLYSEICSLLQSESPVTKNISTKTQSGYAQENSILPKREDLLSTRKIFKEIFNNPKNITSKNLIDIGDKLHKFFGEKVTIEFLYQLNEQRILEWIYCTEKESLFPPKHISPKFISVNKRIKKIETKNYTIVNIFSNARRGAEAQSIFEEFSNEAINMLKCSIKTA